MQIIAEKKFADVVDIVCLVPYTLDMNNERDTTMNTTITTTTCHNCNMEFDAALGFEILWGGQTACISCADALYAEQD